jgi:hypothetical protein
VGDVSRFGHAQAGSTQMDSSDSAMKLANKILSCICIFFAVLDVFRGDFTKATFGVALAAYFQLLSMEAK